MKVKDITKDLYLCSPLLNTKCPKTNCYINNGCCCHTVDKEYSQENLIEKEKDLSDRIVKVSRKIDAFKEKLKQSEKSRQKAKKYIKDITWDDGCIDCEPEKTQELLRILEKKI